MKFSINKKFLTAILILTLATMIIFPLAAAQEVTRKTYAFIGAIPNPVGVDQEVLFHVGITQQLTSVGMGWEGLWITIEKPDGTTDRIENIRTDATGGTGRVYTPHQVGTHTVQAHFPRQKIEEGKTVPGMPMGAEMLASESQELELIVQEEPLEYYPGHNSPEEYWTRPVNAQFHEWASITGSWLRPAGGYTMPPHTQVPSL